MKNKQELAQALSENLDRVNEGMLQQAHDTDTAEKFHALSSKPKTVRFAKKDQSVTTARKIAAIAACLAVALSITVGGISLARHLPGIFGTTPTDPPLTQPPITTQEITISSGIQSIRNPMKCLVSESFCNNGSFVISDGMGAAGVLNDSHYATQIAELPVLTLDGDVSVRLSDGGTIQNIYVYQRVDSGEIGQIKYASPRPEELSQLSHGTWYVAIRVIWSSTCEHGDTETYCNDYLFVLQISQNTPEEFMPGELTISNENSSETLSLHAMAWTETFDAASGTWLRSSGEGADGILYKTDWVEEPYLPSLWLNPPPEGTVNLNLPANATLNDVRVYMQNGPADYTEVEDFPGTIEALQDLPGSWFVVINVTWQGRYIESEGRYEQHCYEYVFTIVVPTQILIGGTCGENATWEFFPDSGTLMISGTGELSWDEDARVPWDAYLDAVTTLVVQPGIISIQGFQYMHNLTAISLPDTLQTIQPNAFGSCTSLSEIQLPDSITTIGHNAFSGCENLLSVQLPAGLTQLESQVFAWCDQLQSITFGSQITHIGERAFTGCRALTQLTLPERLVTIGDGAFSDCQKLQGVSIPDSVTTIGSYAFECCYALSDVHFGDGLTTLGSYAFHMCNALDGVVLPINLTALQEYTFAECNALTTIHITHSIADIHPEALSACPNLSAIWVFAENPYFSSDEQGVLFDKNKTVLLKAPNAISGNYIVPDGVVTISSLAFYRCENLIGITVPDSVTAIEAEVFKECTALVSVSLGRGITTISYNLFESCTSLKQITIPDSVTHIDYSAFYNCTALESISIPSSVKTIAAQAFQFCTALKYVDLPDDLTSIEEGLFQFCSSLQSITIPQNVTTIGPDAFSSCTALESITLPSSLTAIEDHAFSGCTALKTITIPNGVLRLGWRVFNSCTALETVILPGTLQEIGEGAFFDSGLRHILLPASLETIQENTFGSCNHLEYILIPKEITTIAYHAITGSALQYIFCEAAAIPDTWNPHWHNTDAAVLMTGQWEYVDGIPTPVKTPQPGMSGQCGENTTWILDDGVLTISGTGAVTDIAWRYYSDQITKVVVEDGVTAIGESAFNGCNALSQITFPASLTSIGDYAFNNCTALKSLYFYGDPPAIEFYTFNKVNASAYYPAGNEKWERNGLGNKTGNIILYPQGNSGICGDHLTWNYADGVLTISGTGEMYEYSNRNVPPWRQYAAEITQLILPEGLTNISRSAFVGFVNITSLEIPNTVTTIGSQAFSECTGLTSIVIPDSVQTITSMAFNACRNLQTVTIGKGIQLIEMSAFMQCGNLQEVHFLGNMPEMSEAFLYMTLTIYYPAENTTWDPGVLASFGKSITWVPVEMTP